MLHSGRFGSPAPSCVTAEIVPDDGPRGRGPLPLSSVDADRTVDLILGYDTHRKLSSLGVRRLLLMARDHRGVRKALAEWIDKADEAAP